LFEQISIYFTLNDIEGPWMMLIRPSDFREIISAWISRAGDAQISSIANTVLYAVSVLASAHRKKMLRLFRAPLAEQRFWLILFLVLLAFGINKQFDFHILLIEIGQLIARQGHWYESRRIVQFFFALIVTGIAVLFAAIVASFIRRHWRNNALALLGLLILCAYGIIETLSASHVGISLESQERWSIRPSDLIEMAGILLIIINSILHRRRE